MPTHADSYGWNKAFRAGGGGAIFGKGADCGDLSWSVPVPIKGGVTETDSALPDEINENPVPFCWRYKMETAMRWEQA